MNTIYDGTFTIGQTSATNFIAGPGIKIDEPSAGTVRIGNDETVLWSGDTGVSECTLSEPMTNFERIRIYIGTDASPSNNSIIYEVDPNTTNFSVARGKGVGNAWISWIHFSASSTSISIPNTKAFNFGSTGSSAWSNPTISLNSAEDRNSIWKVVGINRISGGNA